MAGYSDRMAVGFYSMDHTTSISTATSLMFQSYLPKELWDPALQSEVEKWLVDNIPEPLLRKEILLDWCAYFKIKFTTEKAKSIGAEKLPPP